MPDVLMPRLSDSMEEATIVNWLVSDGDLVTVGQELAEVETDKATVSFEAEAEGRIELLVQAGETVALGGVVARIGTSDEPIAAAAIDVEPARQEAAERVERAVAMAATDRMPHATPSQRRRMRALASPLARRIAEHQGIDLGAVVGSGPGGRIVKADLATHAAPAAQPARETVIAVTAVTNGSETTGNGSGESHQLSRTQELIARRMSQSRATVPDFDISVEVDMEAACELRANLKAGGSDPAPSLNDIIVMACGRALAEHPKVNSAYKNTQIERYERVNVGIAIATDDSLVVATISDADRRPLGEIARTSRRLASRVRDGSISPSELSGATFTVSNLGMYGIDQFTAVLNPPQAAILAVGAVKERAVAREGQIVCRRTAIMTLAADHRLLYGADAARFLARVQDLLQTPLELLVR